MAEARKKEAAEGEEGWEGPAAEEEAGSDAAEVAVGAVETARSIPGALQMTSPMAFALWGGKFSAVISAFLIGRGLADGNYNSRQAPAR